ncbi:MAG TPA: hypothetical protein VF725_03675 [Ktedonobacterales bacterium]
MSLFIQVEQSLVNHRKTLRLARLRSPDRYAVMGRLAASPLDNAPTSEWGPGPVGKRCEARGRELWAAYGRWQATTQRCSRR